MNMEDYHMEEERLRELIKSKNPNHPILDVLFYSSQSAVEAYWKIERGLSRENE